VRVSEFFWWNGPPPEKKSAAGAKDEGSVQIVSLGFCPWAPITENQTLGKWESGKAAERS